MCLRRKFRVEKPQVSWRAPRKGLAFQKFISRFQDQKHGLWLQLAKYMENENELDSESDDIHDVCQQNSKATCA